MFSPSKSFLIKLIALFVMSIQLVTASEGTFTVAAGEWPPFIGKKINHNGIVGSIISESFANEGMDIGYAFYPWKRAMEQAKKGDDDATAPWSMTEQRNKDFYFSEPIIEEVNILLHRKDSTLKWNDITDLSQYKIGGTIGYFYGKEFEEAEKNKTLQVQRTNKDITNLKKLLAGRVDIFVVEKNVANAMINKLTAQQKSELVMNEKPLNTRNLYLLFSKSKSSNQDKVTAFNKGLKKLRDSGRYKAITNGS